MENQKMKALVLEEFGQPLVLKEIDIPQPHQGEVLIRVESTPINPSDASFLKGSYSSSRKTPCVPGFEGSGVVVKSGGGDIADSLLNKRVAFTAGGQNGTFAQYTTANANFVLPIEDDVTFNQAASSFVNPLTVIAMLETVQQANVKAVVQSAAASALGRMMVRYFKQHGVEVINIVRRPEQIQILKNEGANIILNSNQEDFLPTLKAHATELNATIFFDAVAGPLTGQVLSGMPNGSTAYVYGALSLQEASISPTQLIFRDQSIKGLWLTKWLTAISKEQLKLAILKLQKLIKTELRTEIAQECSLQEGSQAVRQYIKNMSSGKILFKPQLQ
ncbi:hypothetical protein ABPG72_000140 [Tetrahymena utriculariae]